MAERAKKKHLQIKKTSSSDRQQMLQMLTTQTNKEKRCKIKLWACAAPAVNLMKTFSWCAFFFSFSFFACVFWSCKELPRPPWYFQEFTIIVIYVSWYMTLFERHRIMLGLAVTIIMNSHQLLYKELTDGHKSIYYGNRLSSWYIFNFGRLAFPTRTLQNETHWKTTRLVFIFFIPHSFMMLKNSHNSQSHKS